MPKKPFDVELIVGNCVLVPAQAVRECGLMDEKNFVNFGDAEYTPRLKKRGWRLIVEPRARVFCQPNTLAARRLVETPLKDLYRVLWTDSRNQHNLRCRFISYWVGAPTKAQAVLAFVIFLIRLGLRTIGLSRNWFNEKEEKKLSEEYA
jgi:GT2 family glycosyltransferase